MNSRHKPRDQISRSMKKSIYIQKALIQEKNRASVNRFYNISEIFENFKTFGKKQFQS